VTNALTTDQWKEISPYLDEVLEISIERRAAWLLSLNQKDARIAGLVQALLDEHLQLKQENFLETSPLPARAGLAGQKIGAYTLVSEIGHGGMGQVWLAEQTAPIKRQVALKLIRVGRFDDSVLQRFHAERQSLAMMDHPSIAKVFDAGATSDGQPYFVMEYVRGEPITDYCDRRRLSIRERLELFVKVCEGVQHAHQKAVIHRDLKPTNILVLEVDGKPVPRIIDFGLAKAASPKLDGQTLLTQAGDWLGTPGYISPEQADPAVMDVDTRTDVYSLGAVLYVLLTGSQPLETRNQRLDEFLRQLREDEPLTPSSKVSAEKETSKHTAEARSAEPRQLAGLLHGDLDWITMKALEKDRARRYGLPMELAADIERYLRNEPVTARPASFGYRARKYVARHKALVAGVAAVFLVLVAGIITSTWQAVKARRAEAEAKKQSAIAQAVNDFLQKDLLAQASAVTQSGPKTKPDPDLKVRTALDRAAERVSGNFDKQPEVEAAIRETIAQTYLDLGLYPEARTQLERTLELRRKLGGAENPNTLRTISRLGRAAVLQGKYPEAESLFGQILPVQRRVLGAENSDTLYSISNLGSIYYLEGKYEQAEPLFNQTMEFDRRVYGGEHPATLRSSYDLAILYYMQGKYPRAEVLDKQTLEIQRRVLGPEHPDAAQTMSALGLVYFAESKYPEAEALDKQTLDIERRVLGPEHPETLFAMHNLANVYYGEGKFPQAEVLDKQTVEIQRRVLGPEHLQVVTSMDDLASAYYSEGKFAQAEAVYSEALELQRRSARPEDPVTLDVTENLANVYHAQGKYERAESLLRNTWKIQGRVLGAEHPATLNCAHDLALVWQSQGKSTQAEALLLKTLESSKHVLGEEQAFTLVSMAALGKMYQREGRYDLAENYAAQALKGRRHAFGSEFPDTLTSVADLALAYVSQKKYAQCAPLVREAMEVEQKIQPDDWQRFRAESLLGASLAGEKKYADAEPLLIEGYRGMLARKQRIGVPDHYHLQLAQQWLIQFYKDVGKPEEAGAIAKESN
jgi:eukaryotic-like serine/threonine-protein kinase